MKGLQAAFVTLLKVDPEDPGFEVTESADKQEIIIKTPAVNRDALISRLQEIFKSHGHTIGHIPFQLQPVSANSSNGQSFQQFPKVAFPLVDIRDLTGNQIFERLFNKAIGEEGTGNIMRWQEASGQNGQTIYYYVCQSEVEANLRKAQVAIFKSILSHATLEDLYFALAKDSLKPLTVPGDYSTGNGPLTPHLENLFSVRKESGDKFVVRFDCIGLLKCIISPQFVLGVSSSSMDALTPAEIRVNQAHFMAYMSTLLNQGILLQEHHDRLYPIALHGRYAIQQDTLIDFAIDCSSSMLNVFLRLKQVLVNVVKEFPKILDTHATRVRVSRFGSKTSNFPMFEFPLTQWEELVAQISSLPGPVDGEQTAIYQFLARQYESFANLRNVNIVSVLISDGGDNDSAVEYKPNDEQNDRLSIALRPLENAISPPQFFSVEIGQLTEAVLEIIKQKTVGKRIPVGDGLENFQAFFNYLSGLGLSRFFLNFIQQTRRFRLPVVEGKIVIAEREDYLVPNEPFQINGIHYTAQRQTLSSQSLLALQSDEEKYERKESKNQRLAQSEVENEELRKALDEMRREHLEAMRKFQLELERTHHENEEMRRELLSLRNAPTTVSSLSLSLQPPSAGNNTVLLPVSDLLPPSNPLELIGSNVPVVVDNALAVQNQSGELQSRSLSGLSDSSQGASSLVSSGNSSGVSSEEMSSAPMLMLPAFELQRQTEQQKPKQDAEKPKSSGSWFSCAVM